MKRKLLIIEDQLSTRKLLTHYLSNTYDVIEKESATEALEWLNDGHSPDAILLDIMMPEMTGIEFLHELASANLRLPNVLVLSAIENHNEKMKCFNMGVRDYIIKPFNPQELSVRISNAILN